jgi:hypothetical protein
LALVTCWHIAAAVALTATLRFQGRARNGERTRHTLGRVYIGVFQ